MYLSIIIPGIRTENWTNLYKMCSSQSSNIEFIFVGPVDGIPKELSEKKNIKFIRDFGNPSRALQIGAYLAEGKYLTWLCDDITEINIDRIIELAKTIEDSDNVVGLRYTEGDGYKYGQDGRLKGPDWFKAYSHQDLQKPGVHPDWLIAPLFIIRSGYFRSLGGIDCQYETINMNLHDLMFRIQKQGNTISFSDDIIVRLSWQDGKNNNREKQCPIYRAFFENDLPLFNADYGDSFTDIPHINFENWRDTENIWSRKWGQDHIKS